jgi:acetate kinase
VRVLAVNAGSSSLKLTLLDGDDQVIAARERERWPIRRYGFHGLSHR